ncbi:hypothetical protein D9756_002059 [Leucocoprinus leucothites]|uniref:Uncharacterized protein n=1 Tax=Leucocoprinus leucothites TaxID=201217 RepID=A0A8H5GBG7_9AGAR|nr:hypothetical protein D9756_002059 [Leucoagaricus leucothites]
MTLNLNTGNIPKPYGISPIRPHFRTLTLASEDALYGQLKKGQGEIQYALDVARHLDLLFPDLVLLNSSPAAKFWLGVWKVMRLCQNVRDDQKRQKKSNSQS